MMNDDVDKGERIIIFNAQIGYMIATAAEPKRTSPGDSAVFRVLLNQRKFPGVSQMDINVNQWDVWSFSNTIALQEVAKEAMPPEYQR